MVLDVIQRATPLATAAVVYGVSAPTVRKWLTRFRKDGEDGLRDHNSRPHRSPKATVESTALLIAELRRRKLSMQRIAREIGCSVSTVSRVCAREGLSRLPDSPRAPARKRRRSRA